MAITETSKRTNPHAHLTRVGKTASDHEISNRKVLEEKTLKLAAFDQVYLTLMQIDLKSEIASSILLEISKK